MTKKLDVVLIAIVKNEVEYLDEWINYYIALGVSYFVIYDNNSDDKLYAWARKYINLGYLHLVFWPNKNRQIDAYNHAHKLYENIANYLCFFDIDEFLVLKKHSTIMQFMDDMACDQLLIPWLNFSYCNHEKKPQGLVIENYIYAATGAAQVKQIVKPDKVKSIGVHSSAPTEGAIVKFEDGTPASRSSVHPDPKYINAQINHYQTKSYEENVIRLKKGEASYVVNKNLADFKIIDYETQTDYVKDTEIFDKIEQTKKLIEFHNNIDEDCQVYLNENYSKFHTVNYAIQKLLICIGNFFDNDIIKRTSKFKFTSLNKADVYELQESLNKSHCEVFIKNKINFNKLTESNNFLLYIQIFRLAKNNSYSTSYILIEQEYGDVNLYKLKLTVTKEIRQIGTPIEIEENRLILFLA